MGQLALMILDNKTPVKMSIEETGEPFEIALLDEGSLTIVNYRFKIYDDEILLKTTYNSKANYPMYIDNEGDEYLVFDESGNFNQSFIDFCETI
jgi:hypothetical protein